MDLISLLVAVIVAGLLFWLVTWFVDYIGLPDPFNKVAKVVIAVIALLYILGMFTGYAPVFKLR